MRAAQATLVLLVITIWQVASGLGQLGFAPEGWSLVGSHARSGEIALLISFVVPVLVVKSKTQISKLKGMSFGLATMVFFQVGLAHMIESMPSMGMVHAVLALGIMSHGTILYLELNREGSLQESVDSTAE